jgi:hypothetical protein
MMLHFISPSYIQLFADADFGDAARFGHGDDPLVLCRVNSKPLPLLINYQPFESLFKDTAKIFFGICFRCFLQRLTFNLKNLSFVTRFRVSSLITSLPREYPVDNHTHRK